MKLITSGCIFKSGVSLYVTQSLQYLKYSTDAVLHPTYLFIRLITTVRISDSVNCNFSKVFLNEIAKVRLNECVEMV